ncbi:MAG: phosphatase PAP2 family protein [Bacteroidales bacterium]
MIKYIHLGFFCLIFLISGHIYGQKTFLDSTDKKTMLRVGGASSVLLTTAFIYDDNINRFTLDNQTRFLTDYADAFYHLGNKKIIIPLNAIVYGGSWAIGNERLKTTSATAFKSILSTAILTEGGKQIFGRTRPYMDKGPYHFRSMPILRNNSNHYKSLPSGHASLAFAFFTPYAEEYSRWIYLVPASVAFNRVYKNKHWLSDVLLGSLIGWTSGYFFHHKTENVEITLNSVVIKF